MPNYEFYTNCVNWPASDVHADGGLIDLIDGAKEITRSSFLRHVDREQMRALEMELGYSVRRDGGLTMNRDYHVSYHRSNYMVRQFIYSSTQRLNTCLRAPTSNRKH